MAGNHTDPLVLLAAALQQLQRASHTVHELLEHRPCRLLSRCKQASVVFTLDPRRLCVQGCDEKTVRADSLHLLDGLPLRFWDGIWQH